MRRKKIHYTYEFRLMKKMKGAHLKRPQLHFGDCFERPSEYRALSDSHVIELRDWLSRYINEFVHQAPAVEITKASRVCAQRIIKNMNRIEADL